MTDDKPSPRAFQTFEDGHALTYTMREIYDGTGEFQSQHYDLAAAADAFAVACLQARCVELRDMNGRVIAGYVRGQGHCRAQGGAS